MPLGIVSLIQPLHSTGSRVQIYECTNVPGFPKDPSRTCEKSTITRSLSRRLPSPLQLSIVDPVRIRWCCPLAGITGRYSSRDGDLCNPIAWLWPKSADDAASSLRTTRGNPERESITGRVGRKRRRRKQTQRKSKMLVQGALVAAAVPRHWQRQHQENRNRNDGPGIYQAWR